MDNKLTREECILLIQQKYENGQLPKKSDFDIETVSRMKAFWGPWPRVLEAAGVKEPNQERIERKKAKRRRAKENQIKYRKEHPKEK